MQASIQRNGTIAASDTALHAVAARPYLCSTDPGRFGRCGGRGFEVRALRGGGVPPLQIRPPRQNPNPTQRAGAGEEPDLNPKAKSPGAHGLRIISQNPSRQSSCWKSRVKAVKESSQVQ